MKRCPFCGSTEGYYMVESVRRVLYFNYNNESYEAGENVVDKELKRRYCTHCNSILPRKMFEGED